MSTEFTIRPILRKDNEAVATLIRGILEDMGVPKVGTAYADRSLDEMYETYQKPKCAFYVIALNNDVIGCAGIAPLEGYPGKICELQKMYISANHRGKGLATKLLDINLQKANDFGFEGCYLETMPFMEPAQNLYIKNGFDYLKEPLGDTGHSAGTVRMLKKF